MAEIGTDRFRLIPDRVVGLHAGFPHKQRPRPGTDDAPGKTVPRTPEMKKTIAVLGLVAIIVMLIVLYQATTPKIDSESGSSDQVTGSHWTWFNPVTGKSAAIPVEWKQSRGESVRNTLLTLEHWTGKAVIYLVHDETGQDMSLSDYVEARSDAVKKGLGIETLHPSGAEEQQYLGEGAKYFGDTIAGTQVRIWITRSGSFWRMARITDMEYRELEYAVQNVADALMESTRQDYAKDRQLHR